MEGLKGLIAITVIVILFVNKIKRDENYRQGRKDRIQRIKSYEKIINQNGNITKIKRTYNNGNMEEQITGTTGDNIENLFEDFRKQKDEMDEFLNQEPKKNNNRHSYMYHDIEQEIIKVDPGFTKEVFLNNAKEIFLKYLDSLVKNEVQDLNQFSTDDFISSMQNKIDENKENRINVIINKPYVELVFLHDFNKSTEYQVITVRIRISMKYCEKDDKQYVITGNEYSNAIREYKMEFVRKNKGERCRSCGAPIDMNDLTKCQYCGSLLNEKDEWKLNSIYRVKGE